MKLRKTILLSAIGVLLCVYIIQLISSGKSSIKTLSLKSEPTEYTIASGGSDVVLSKDGDNWIVGEKKYKANQAFSDNIKDAVTNIKVLDTVSHSDDEAVLERYGLDKDKALTVNATDSNGKTVRTITVGKESSTGSQTYIKVDSNKDIYLVSGSLKNTFGKTVDEMRSKEVFNVKADDLTKVSVSVPGSTWSVERSGENDAWSLVGQSATLDDEKVNAWINTLPILNVQEWRKETDPMPRIAGTTATITAGDKEITVTVYEIQNEDKTEYIGTSSETPYSFIMSQYVAGKFCKKLDDLKKSE